jgi:hypothetical protein
MFARGSEALSNRTGESILTNLLTAEDTFPTCGGKPRWQRRRFDCMASFSSWALFAKQARIRSRSSDREPEGNLDWFLACLHTIQQNEATESE